MHMRCKVCMPIDFSFPVYRPLHRVIAPSGTLAAADAGAGAVLLVYISAGGVRA